MNHIQWVKSPKIFTNRSGQQDCRKSQIKIMKKYCTKLSGQQNSFCDINVPKVHKSLLHVMPCIWYTFQTVQCPENVHTVHKCSKLSGSISECPETFQAVWKLSRPSGNFPDRLETFQTIWKLSGPTGNFLDYLETFQTVWKLSRLSRNFPDHPETSQCNFKSYAQKISGCAKTFRRAMLARSRGFWASAYVN